MKKPKKGRRARQADRSHKARRAKAIEAAEDQRDRGAARYAVRQVPLKYRDGLFASAETRRVWEQKFEQFEASAEMTVEFLGVDWDDQKRNEWR